MPLKTATVEHRCDWCCEPIDWEKYGGADCGILELKPCNALNSFNQHVIQVLCRECAALLLDLQTKRRRSAQIA